MFSPQIFQETLSWKPSQIFLLLKSVFHWPTFLLANKHKKVWKVISRKPLSGKQTQLKGKHFSENQVKIFFNWNWPESIFRWPTFLMTNKHRKVWKIVSRKLLSRKQTWPKNKTHPHVIEYDLHSNYAVRRKKKKNHNCENYGSDDKWQTQTEKKRNEQIQKERRLHFPTSIFDSNND